MAWKQDPASGYPEVYPFVNELLEVVNRELENVLREHSERGLIDAIARIYWNSWWSIKLISGTSGQWPWLAEYLVFHAVKQGIEDRFSMNLVPTKNTDYIWRFDAKDQSQYSLFHNSFLRTKCISERNLQPDVFLCKNGQIIFTMDVKVAVSSSKTMNNALEKLTFTAKRCKSQAYLVSVAQNLTFSVSRVKKAFREFDAVNGKVVGPLGGSLEKKMEELGYPLLKLEDSLTSIYKKL